MADTATLCFQACANGPESTLTAEGAPFELTTEVVGGQLLSVFAQRHRTLRDMLDASRAFGEREYLVAGSWRLSFDDHYRAVSAVAAGLAASFGVEAGDRVVLFGANSAEWILCYWALVAMGAVPVAANGWWTATELERSLEPVRPRLLLGDGKRLDRISGDPGTFFRNTSENTALSGATPRRPGALECFDFHSLVPELLREFEGSLLPASKLKEDDPASILFTSGTSGLAKGAVHTHRNILAVVGMQHFHGARVLMEAMNEGRVDPMQGPPPARLLINSPLFHVSGLYAGAVTALAGGATTIWPWGRYDPEATLRMIESEHVTSWSPMGTMLHRALEHDELASFDLSSVTTMGNGGAPLRRDMQARAREVFPNASPSFAVGYGLTECTGLATIIYGDQLREHPDSVGSPLPGVEVSLRDESGEVVSPGAVGEIYLRGAMVMAGYYGCPDASAAALAPGGWLRTGDYGRIRDGLLYLEARMRDLILRGGENVYPWEIEKRLEAHADVLEAAVVGRDHADLGQQVHAVVVTGTPLESRELSEWVAMELAAFKVPETFEFRSTALPRNAAGKIMKEVLTGRQATPFAGGDG